MDSIVRRSESESFEIECPHCGRSEEDEYEVIPQGSLQSMHCVGCHAEFHFAVMDCEACGAEHFLAWKRAPTADTFERLACSACGRRYVEHEDASETDGLSL